LKGFLLAAGHGTRLRPLTDQIPKCLLPIHGIPILEIWLRLCCTVGIDEVLVNIHSHAELVRNFLARRVGPPNVRVVEESNLLGSAGTLAANRAWVESEELFWVFYADVLTNLDFRPMLKMHKARNPAATLGVYVVPDPRRCGIVELGPDGAINGFVEKPLNTSNNLAFSGVMIGTRDLLNLLPEVGRGDLGFDVFPRLTRMVAYRIPDYIIDIGTIDNYKLAQATWPGL
jgi:mannose-1-phosphate guanylyltransferase